MCSYVRKDRNTWLLPDGAVLPKHFCKAQNPSLQVSADPPASGIGDIPADTRDSKDPRPSKKQPTKLLVVPLQPQPHKSKTCISHSYSRKKAPDTRGGESSFQDAFGISSVK